ncbi:hypothetical protein GCM10008023_01790 [Sphingomonas glacialis]|uniref:Uncharacterized protein n=1 Tax=Sphingomonas glacialis TaxID=658225 RepID=A0ABQ3L880_9SPHN|nr:hypothetical protein GCM10008023_01790 [Sphingomonas glacialis]
MRETRSSQQQMRGIDMVNRREQRHARQVERIAHAGAFHRFGQTAPVSERRLGKRDGGDGTGYDARRAVGTERSDAASAVSAAKLNERYAHR